MQTNAPTLPTKIIKLNEMGTLTSQQLLAAVIHLDGDNNDAPAIFTIVDNGQPVQVRVKIAGLHEDRNATHADAAFIAADLLHKRL